MYDNNSGNVNICIQLTMPGISVAASNKVVSFKIMSGLLNQDKLINLKFCPLIIQMEFM
jgi:hypothetical protein